MSEQYRSLDHFAQDFKQILQIGNFVSPRVVKAVVKAMATEKPPETMNQQKSPPLLSNISIYRSQMRAGLQKSQVSQEPNAMSRAVTQVQATQNATEPALSAIYKEVSLQQSNQVELELSDLMDYPQRSRQLVSENISEGNSEQVAEIPKPTPAQAPAKFYKGNIQSLISDFTKTFSILSPERQREAKNRYPQMNERFQKLVKIDNAYLPFYMALVEQPEASMDIDFRKQNPKRYLDYLYWLILNEPKHQCRFCYRVFRKDSYYRMHAEKDQ